jgi:HD-GYP domain-containing protein (c-di-GMP phosphodiesterase class II)
LHDVGRLGVSNAIWDKPGPLSATEVEGVRLHPYLTERMLASSPPLAALGVTAAQHHEHIDGSGYPRNLRGDPMTAPGKLLATGNAYAGKLEPRPHRPALTAPEAPSTCEKRYGPARQESQSVSAVLEAAAGLRLLATNLRHLTTGPQA